MKIINKLALTCFILSFSFPTLPIKTRIKLEAEHRHIPKIFARVPGIISFLFPFPSKLYNGEFNQNFFQESTNRNIKYSFFEIIAPGEVKVTFADVAGLDGAKEDMQDIIEYLKEPDRFIKMGASAPTGILMNGHPGNGKTLLARALAGQVNCSFIHINGSDFCNSEYMGIGSKKVQELFKAARAHAPCIIFIDEIDSVGSKRSAGNSSGGMIDHNNTLTTLLAEMDGFTKNIKPVIVIAATNRVDQLDPALKRPGRFDRVIEICKPFIKDRMQLLRIACAKSPLSDDIDLERIAQTTAGFSGAELTNLINEAAILAVKDNATMICMHHIEWAHDNITLGRETKGMQQSREALWRTAIHEAGHLIGFLFQGTNTTVHKVSITPRGKTLGVAHMLPLVESYELTQEDMQDNIIACLAGRFAEEAFGFGLGSGASNDLEKAQRIAYNMVVSYGMADNFRDISYAQFDDQLPNDIATKIHHEVNNIIEKCRYITRNLIADHKDDIEKIAQLLMEKGTVQGCEIYELLNLPQPQKLCLHQ